VRHFERDRSFDEMTRAPRQPPPEVKRRRAVP
jgi:hypothetical protein